MSSGSGGDVAQWVEVGDFGHAVQRHEVKLSDAWCPGWSSTKAEFPDGSTIEVVHDLGPVFARGVLVSKHEVSIRLSDREGEEEPCGIVFFYDDDAEPLAARFVSQTISRLWDEAKKSEAIRGSGDETANA